MSAIRMPMEDFLKIQGLLDELPSCFDGIEPFERKGEMIWHFEHKGEEYTAAWIYLCELAESKEEAPLVPADVGKPAWLS